MFRSVVERSTISPSRVSFAISRLAAPKISQCSYLIHNNILPSSSIAMIHQHRNYSLVQRMRKIFQGELEKNKELKESIDELKKVTDSVKETKVAQDVIQTANVGLTKGKGIVERTKTYIVGLKISERFLKNFEKTSDKVTDAVSNIPKKYTKFYPGSEEEKAEEKKAADAAKDQQTNEGPNVNDPMASTETSAETIKTDQAQAQAADAVKPEEEPVQATQETAQGTAQETEEKEKVYDIVPVAEKKKNWFSISHSSSLAKTVERIRIYHPNFSIVDFMHKINPIHHDFLVALYTQDMTALSELAVPDFVEKIQASIVPLKPGEQSNKCHVLELYDAELDSTDPERVAIKVTFEAQIVITDPEGGVIPLAYDRSEKTTQVTQIRGAFEWIFEEANITINDFAIYTTEVIY